MPDFLFQRDGVPFGWAEAKDIDKDVIALKGYSKEQRQRYENAYPNLIYTNGVEPAAIGDAPYPFIGDGDDLVAAGHPKFQSSPLGEGDHPQDGGGAPSHDVPGGEGAPPPSSTVPLPVPGRTGRVLINADQYFDAVPRIAWEFHIGGYQPAQKWLKDRKGRSLSYDDIRHYQSIVKIRLETDRIIRTIELPLDE